MKDEVAITRICKKKPGLVVTAEHVSNTTYRVILEVAFRMTTPGEPG